ncbi:FMN-dependent NADH-azoreductase [Spiroplasma sp. AdecLV25b]|uniref:FMN-dependent NADH-azoreductase n=1 Tax=Spiroplasma sp. AdecLV25b TaxID=3027162 RepID=UPI0027DFAEF3|nr:FMN-dependent NADH-azoreductase [Spiroplasma sp. AdecLV25b]
MSNKVLVIKSSPITKEKSYSTALGNRFVKYYREFHQEDEIIELDLNEIDMSKKNINTHNFNEYFNETDSDFYINQLKSVQKVIFVSPMINFNISPIGKTYLDHILVANKTFSYKYQKKGDAIGLLDNLKVQILTTQGAPFSWYPWGNHTEYLRGTWNFVGAKVVEPILVAGTKVKPEGDLTPEQLIDKYDTKIKSAAKEF